MDIYKEYVFYRNRGGIKIDHWDKREKSKPKGFLSLLDFDTFYHRGKKEKVFMNILVLMGVAHITIFSIWLAELILIYGGVFK